MQKSDKNMFLSIKSDKNFQVLSAFVAIKEHERRTLIYGEETDAHRCNFYLGVILCTFRWMREGGVVRDKEMFYEQWLFELDLNRQLSDL